MKKAITLILAVLLCLAMAACEKETSPTLTATPAVSPTPTVEPTPTPAPTMTSEAAVAAFLAAADKTNKLPETSYTGTGKVIMLGMTIETTTVMETINDAENPMMHVAVSMGNTSAGEYYINKDYIAMDMMGTKMKITLPEGANPFTGEGMTEVDEALSLEASVSSNYPAAEDIQSVAATSKDGGWELVFTMTDSFQKKMAQDDTATISEFAYTVFVDADGYVKELTMKLKASSEGMDMEMESTFTLQDPSKDVTITFPDLTEYQEMNMEDLLGGGV